MFSSTPMKMAPPEVSGLVKEQLSMVILMRSSTPSRMDAQTLPRLLIGQLRMVT